MGELSADEHRSLLWLSRQNRLMWGGIFDRGGGDAVVARLLAFGYIEGIAKEVHVGKAVFRGGYQITDAGRAKLKEPTHD